MEDREGLGEGKETGKGTENSIKTVL